MEYLQEVYLDINPNNSHLVVTAKQYDSNTRGIIAHIMRDGQPYTITGTNIIFRVKKPDGHIVIGDTTINQDGTVKVIFSAQCLAAYGRAYADLVEINNEDGILSTTSFIIDIKPSPNIDETSIESTDDYQIIYNFIANAQDVIDSVREWADGYHGLTPVDSSSPAYNNHAKYWALKAKNIADTLDFSLDLNTGILSFSYEE